MLDGKEKMPGSDEVDPQSDALSPSIAAALADLALPPLPDETDSEPAERFLTEADRAALSALGNSKQLVARLLATPTSGVQRAVAASEVPTISGSLLSTKTGVPGEPQAPEVMCDFAALMDCQRTVEQSEEVSCPSRYRKGRELGRGGQGIVFLAECLDELSGVQALKIYLPEPYGSADAYREEMERLLHVASRVHVIHHDNLLDVARFFKYKNIYLMVMQWIDGCDLHHLLQPYLLDRVRRCVTQHRWHHLNEVVFSRPAPGRLCLQPGIAVDIVEKCLRALAGLHGAGIVHGDIKQSNIMLDRYGSIKVIDIGSAFELSAPPTHRMWTPRYAPPEFITHGRWTPQSDLASLGYVLIELLSGQPVFSGPRAGDRSTRTRDRDGDEALLAQKLELPRRLPELLPERARASQQLVNLCQRLIAPDPARRFVNADDAIEGAEGTNRFRNSLVVADLAVYNANEIKRWLEDVKKVDS